jgi:hypothetical protein
MKLIIPLVFAYAAFLGASANGGGFMDCSYDQCVATFGNPVEHKSGELNHNAYEAYIFRKDPYLYVIIFFHERASIIQFSKLDETPITSDDANIIFATYGDGQGWESTPSGRFTRTDHSVVIEKGMSKITVGKPHALHLFHDLL